MTILRPAPVSTSVFTYVSRENLLVSEASNLPAAGRVFDDACDTGYTVVSHVTGREIVYAIIHEERDREGDLVYWDLGAVKQSDIGTVPMVRIYND